jgi:putative sulfotransferase
VSGARFIVTTGRCGSTLLSNLLREHPSVLSVSELFSSLHSLQVSAFPSGPLSGREMWRIVTTPRPEVNQLMRGCEDGEALAAAGLEPGRIPPLLMGALRDLSPDPLGLHEDLGAFVRELPSAPAGAQYGRMLDWLCAPAARPGSSTTWSGAGRTHATCTSCATAAGPRTR